VRKPANPVLCLLFAATVLCMGRPALSGSPRMDRIVDRPAVRSASENSHSVRLTGEILVSTES